MDFQAGVVERFGSAEVVRSARQALAAARRHGVPVVFVRVGFREGTPEASARNRSFTALAGQPAMREDSPTTQVVAELEPLASELPADRPGRRLPGP